MYLATDGLGLGLGLDMSGLGLDTYGLGLGSCLVLITSLHLCRVSSIYDWRFSFYHANIYNTLHIQT